MPLATGCGLNLRRTRRRPDANPLSCNGETMFGTTCLRIAVCAVAGLLVGAGAVRSQPPKAEPPLHADDERAALGQSLGFTEQLLARKIDEQMLFQALADVAQCDKVRYTGPPPRVVKNPTAPGAKNPVVIPAYTFLPKKYLTGQKLPLIVFAHGGVHGNVGASYVNVFRELLGQGYAVIAPDYRGSSGYGREFWELIDYGGLEVEDVFAGRQFMLEAHDNIDPDRVGIMGWSHGGLITLMNLFAHPKEFKVGLRRGAGVRPGRPDGLPRPGLPRPVLGPVPHRQDRPRGRGRVPPPVAGVERREAADAGADPHDDQRRGRPRAGGREPDQGAEGGRQDVRAQGLQGRARRAPVQPPRHEVRAGVAGRGVPLPGEVPEPAEPREVDHRRLLVERADGAQSCA